MEFLIPLRNSLTGQEKSFRNKQEIADFLRDEESPELWEGHAHLGALPDPTAVEPEADQDAVLPEGETAAPESTEQPASEAPPEPPSPVARAVAAVKKAVAKKAAK